MGGRRVLASVGRAMRQGATVQSLREHPPALPRFHAKRTLARAMTVVLLAAAMVAATTAVNVATAPRAAADPGDPLAPLLNTALLVGDTPAGTVPNPSLDGLYSATPGQFVSLGNLEARAVRATVADHVLPASDTAAAQTWGRSAAEIELWGLLVQAIQTPPVSRTADQTNAVAWLQTVVAREQVAEVQDAGLEYVKWAGLGASAYQALLAGHPSEATLETFLRGIPNNYGGGESLSTPKSTSNEGYCVYVSPTVDTHASYKDNIYEGAFGHNTASPTCYGPCPTPLGCIVEPPSIEEFMEWGVEDSLGSILAQPSLSRAVLGMAKQFGFAAAGTLGAAVPGGVDAGPALDIDLVKERIEQLTHNYLPEVPGYVGAVLDVAEKIVGLVSTFAVEIPGVGEVLSVLATALEIYNFVIADEVPGQIARAITTAATAAPPDLAEMLNGDSGGVIFNLFAGATGRTPQLTLCDNNPIGAIAVPCLNPPPVLASSPNDTQLQITKRNGATTTTATTVVWTDQATRIENTAYFVGDWVVDTSTRQSGSSLTYQTLNINYTDWSGAEQTAWVVPSGSSGYQFVTARVGDEQFRPSTCAADGLCRLTSSIQMVKPDGTQFTLTLPFGNGVPPIPSVQCSSVCIGTGLSMSASPAIGEVGKPITLNANAIVGLVGTVTFVDDVDGRDTTLCADVQAGGFTTSCTWTPSAPGGNQVYATFTPAAGQSTAPAQASVFVPVSEKVATTTSLTASASTVALGAPITYTATVADFYDSDIATPGGVVTFSAGGTDLCSAVPLVAGAGGSTATCPTTFDTAGRQKVAASYSGDAATTASAGSTTTVVPQGPTVIHLVPLSALVVGQPTPMRVTLTAAGVPSDAFTGSVTIVDTANPNRSCSAPVAAGIAECDFTPASAGTVTLRVTYQNPRIVFPAPRILYDDLGGTTTATETVDAANLTITASSSSIAYGQPAPTVTASYSGFVNGDTQASLSTAPTCSTTATTGSAVGTYPTSCMGAVDPDYVITYVAGAATVRPAPLTITAASLSSTYGSPPPVISAIYSGFVNGETPSALSTPPACTTSATSSSPVGTYKSSCSAAVDGNYDISYLDGTVTVSRAPLQIKASDAVMAYGTAPPTITASYAGFVNGETPAALTTQPTCSTTAQSNSPPGVYPSTCSGAAASNYAISYLNGAVTVNRAATSLSTTSDKHLATFTATLTRTDDGAPIGGQSITFAGGGTVICTATTGADGVAICSDGGKSHKYITQGYTATFAGNDVFAPSSASGGRKA
jgi:MBG domain (YGX type)/Bacterial Ig-like domain (group 3)